MGDQARMLRRHALAYVDGITDDELHWEPAPGMWGVRLKTELRTPLEEGAPEGPYWMDAAAVEDIEAPLTTIAWRIGHLTLGTWNWNAIIAGHEVPPEPAMRHDAAGMLELWREVLDSFVDVVGSFDTDALDATVEAWDEPVARSLLVSHVTLEIALHSAEIGTMRHLKRQLESARA